VFRPFFLHEKRQDLKHTARYYQRGAAGAEFWIDGVYGIALFQAPVAADS